MLIRIVYVCLFTIFSYFSIGAYILQNQMPSFIFPLIPLEREASEIKKLELNDSSKNGILIREYGQFEKSCMVFFPGQRGGIHSYEKKLFSSFQKNEFKVFSISYSGQDGAKGRVNEIASLLELISDAMDIILLECSPKNTIVYGRSLGATIAAYTTSKLKLSGLILEGASPSLSIAISNYVNSIWYLKPLGLLPIYRLLPNDYKLKKPLSLLTEIPISIFQGAYDKKTLLKQLQQEWGYGANVYLHIVKNGNHSTTYIQALDEIISVAKSMVM